MAFPKHYEFDNQSSIPAPFNETIPAFFREWDNPTARTEELLEFFALDAKFIFSHITTNSREALGDLRRGLIHPENGPVVDCGHTLRQFYALTGQSDSKSKQFLVKGLIWYKLRNGRRVDAGFVTYMSLVQSAGGKWQSDLYEIFLDSHEIFDAIKELQVTA
ncbi:hypothetical protein Z517_08409 [Fonsecaea pedrosoi CBS 271.37]|uniref:SnoaL-like domain-containing protein n=1 Tax=Fonsecaea pedrosoi CBS 271.37 TaxID=1442368 RepID=A0A0D2DLP9_9EURO|nr:uncharacterized protein Z517_08409 [Fonsecaea pedrosoi CBS 271.37]KIW78571.1 hypothetical protein Z517_08409 [Fonsecaea pedrosoi CBS 271.37]